MLSVPPLQKGKPQHCIQRGWTKDWRNHYGDTQSFSSNKEISRVRNKSAGYVSSLKEKSTSPPTVPPGNSQFFSYSHTVQLAPIFNIFLWIKSQTQLHTQLPQRDSEFLAHQLSGIFDNSHCAGCTWKRVLSSTAIWAPHYKPQLPQQNKTSTKFCSYSPDEHFMNWNSKEPNSGNNCFYKQEILVSSIAKSGLPLIKSYFMLSTQCLYTSNTFSAVLRMRSLIGWRQNYKNKKKIPNLNL